MSGTSISKDDHGCVQVPRRAVGSDVAALVTLRAEMFKAMGVDDGCEDWRANAHAWFRARIDDPAYGIFVVEHDGRVVACAVGALRDAAPSPGVPSGGDVLISNVCTEPRCRGRGYGRAVFDAVMQWARQTGVGRAELMATEAGRQLYERAGFKITHSATMRTSLS
ncbi:GNAT family N-acetyltransferase [Microlunatus elymi]|uniref:GNAT family N-acetyltransferase n=1 Tax=Microlunatus elymi TaxID=2596828 RepID=UPI001AEFAC03|nr:GNAT family N-acetyltransferase [Microlunatus elymi]